MDGILDIDFDNLLVKKLRSCGYGEKIWEQKLKVK